MLPISVSASGAVHLGPGVVCDGFAYGAKIRVQTHVHLDHMGDFDASKGFQDLLMTAGTRDLLIAERNADLEYRENIKTMQLGTPAVFDASTINLLSSGHILGSVQTSVELPDGRRLGYSGDFRWPLDSVIQVDGLVVDSTYGSPDYVREYSQTDVEARFVELVVKQMQLGSVRIKAHRGTLQRAMELLAGLIDAPVIGTAGICREIDVYRRWGYCIEPALLSSSPEGRLASRSKHISLYGSLERWPEVSRDFSTIVLSAFSVRPNDPVAAYSDRSFRIAMSDHADFNGTLDYVAATGATYVVTDSVRGPNADTLAEEIRHRLGIEAVPSASAPTAEWGV